MMTLPSGQAIEYSLYASRDAEEMIRLLGGIFARRDPPAFAVDITPGEFEDFVRLFCPKAHTEALTILAREAATGVLLGALLTEDSASPPPDGLDGLSPKFDPIFDILGQLDTEYRADRPLVPGECLHLFLLGVAGTAAGNGVAQRLVAESLANGRRRGYRVAVTEATNPTSQHIFRKLGFVERARRSYAEHRFEGRAVFASIAGHGGPMLMDKPLT